jgi:hypothetical protein
LSFFSHLFAPSREPELGAILIYQTVSRETVRKGVVGW